MELDATSTLEPLLHRGERLLWTGRPRQGMYLRRADWRLIPFSLFWGGFAVFWETAVTTIGAPLIMQLCGVPFLLIGLYLLFGRFVVDAMARRRTVYGVTTERVIIVGGVISVTTYSHQLPQIQNAELIQHSDGFSTIELNASAASPVLYGHRAAWSVWHAWSPATLEHIPDGRTVYDMILSPK